MVQVSKSMSYVLRHGAEKEKILINAAGYIKMDDLLAYVNRKDKITLGHVMFVVENNDKKRFEVMTDNGIQYIRASQGHTLVEVKTEDLLTKIEDPFKFH